MFGRVGRCWEDWRNLSNPWRVRLRIWPERFDTFIILPFFLTSDDSADVFFVRGSIGEADCRHQQREAFIHVKAFV